MNQIYEVFYFEDDRDVAKPIREFLERTPVKSDDPNLRVHYYADVREALKAIDDWSAPQPPDVALLDLHQKDYMEAGLEICEKIGKRWPVVPIVFLSDYADIGDQNRGVLAGGSVYLDKTMLRKPDHRQLIRNILVSQGRRTKIVETWEPDQWETGSLKVNMKAQLVWWCDKKVDLSPADVSIVNDLASRKRRGKLRTYRDLAYAGHVKSDNYSQLRSNVRKRIQSIRDAFEAVDVRFKKACEEEHHGIITVLSERGNEESGGYRWESDVSDVSQ